MPLVVRTTVTGEDTTERHLLSLGARANNPAPVLEAIAQMMRDRTEERFDAEGPGWTPLAESTKRRKAAEGLDPRILHATLALRRSLTEDDAGGYTVILNNALIFGTSVPYARFHQKGEGLPQRKVLDFDETDERAWSKAIQRWVVEGDAASIAVAGGII